MAISQMELLQKITKDIENWYTYFQEQNDRFIANRKFIYVKGCQWSDTERNERNLNGLITFELNVMKPAIKKIVGDLLPELPKMDASPIPRIGSTTASVDSNIISGLLNQIQYDSDGRAVYSQNMEHLITGGYTALLASHDYEDSDTFDQKVEFEGIADPTSCYWDPRAQKPNKQDGDYCGYYRLQSKEDFIARYSKRTWEEVRSAMRSSMPSSPVFTWFNDFEDQITVCYDFRKEYFKKKIVELEGGQIMDKKEYDQMIEDELDKLIMLGEELGVEFTEDDLMIPQIVQERSMSDYRIVARELVGDEILSKTSWPSKELPLVFISAGQILIDGEDHLECLAENAMDAQRALNFTYSSALQSIKNTPRGRWMGTAEQFSGYEDYWDDPEGLISSLIYNAVPGMPPPEFIAPPPFPAAMMEEINNGIQRVYLTLGRGEASQGLKSNEISGVAVLARVAQDNHGVREIFNNFVIGLHQLGRVILSLIPTIYSSTRMLKVYMQDSKDEWIPVNVQNAMGEIENDLTQGDYQVEISIGAPNELQRAQDQAQMANMLPLLSNPVNLPWIDVLAKTATGNEANDIYQRARKLQEMNSPQLVAAIEGKQLPPQPPSPQQQMEMQGAQAKIQDLMADAKLKEAQTQATLMKMGYEGEKLTIENQKIQQQLTDALLNAHNQTMKNAADIYKTEAQLATDLQKHHNSIVQDVLKEGFKASNQNSGDYAA